APPACRSPRRPESRRTRRARRAAPPRSIHPRTIPRRRSSPSAPSRASRAMRPASSARSWFRQPGGEYTPDTVTVGRRLRVVEPFRSLFYAPQFVAIHGGHLGAEGLEIALSTAARAGGTVEALRNGSADLALGGLMRSFELVDRGGPRLVHFAAGERSQRVLPPEPASAAALRMARASRPDGDLVRRRADAVALHVG